jgi:hypothetical protein
MAAKKRGANVPSKAGESEARSDELKVGAPKKSFWQLVVSGVLVGLWLIFLAWMAFTG